MALAFDEIIHKYRENSASERNKGDKFERLMKAYLLAKPVYKNVLSDAWLWPEFPYKDQFGAGGKDTGVDIVCRTHDGEYWAVQCKCYRPEARIDLRLVGTFLTTASFPFNTKDGKKNFSHRVWIDTTYDGFTAEALNAINKVGCTRLGLIDLKNDDVNWEALDAGKTGGEAGRAKYDLRPHQREAFDATIRAECHGNIQFHYSRPRRISMREAMRIQSFPDTFVFPCGLYNTERHIGNAVSPVLDRHMANTLRKELSKNAKLYKGIVS